MLVRGYEYADGQLTTANSEISRYAEQGKNAHWAVQDVTRAAETGLLVGHNGILGLNLLLVRRLQRPSIIC
mgnify:CR=1 FL=1